MIGTQNSWQVRNLNLFNCWEASLDTRNLNLFKILELQDLQILGYPIPSNAKNLKFYEPILIWILKNLNCFKC